MLVSQEALFLSGSRGNYLARFLRKAGLGSFGVLLALVMLVQHAEAALQAEFKFEETSGGVIDTQGNVVGASVIGTVTQGSPQSIDFLSPSPGNAIVFDSVGGTVSSGVSLTNAAAVAPTDNFTITMFARRDAATDFERLVDLTSTLSNNPNGNAGVRIQANNDAANWRLLVQDGGVLNRDAIAAPTAIQDDTWYFVAARFSGTANLTPELSLTVVDVNSGGTGLVEADITTATGTAVATHGAISYGGLFGGGNLGRGIGVGGEAVGFSGSLDEVRFYDNVLSDADLLSLVSGVSAPLPELVIDRDTGTIDLINATAINLLPSSYSITSAVGALDPASRATVAANYDLSGDGSVDTDEEWTVDVDTNFEFTESVAGNGDIDNLPTTIRLGNAGTWIANSDEDVAGSITLVGGDVINVAISFVGNGGSSFDVADLNTDGTVDAADWLILQGNLNGPTLSGSLSEAQLAVLGDLNGDFDVDRKDFFNFKEAFNASAGAGALEAVIAAAVPEPSSLILMTFACSAVACGRRRNRLISKTKTTCNMTPTSEESDMNKTTASTFSRSYLTAVALMTAFLLGGNTLAVAQTTFNGSIDLDILNAGNWSNGLPSSVNAGTVPTGFATVDNGTLVPNTALTDFVVTFEGTSTLTGPGTQTDRSTITLQDSSSWINSGTPGISRNDDLGTATLNIQDNASLTAAVDIKLGRKGTGILNQSGGTVTIESTSGSDLELGNNNQGGIGLYNMTGGTADIFDQIQLQNESIFSLANGVITAESIRFFDPSGGDSISTFDFPDFMGGDSQGILAIRNGGADYTADLEAMITNGNFTINGSSATTSDFNIDYNNTTTTLSLGAVNLVPLNLNIDPTTGEMTLSNDNTVSAGNVAIDYYEIRSATGDLIPTGPGDYNGDGNVDAADYTVWRDNLGSTSNLDADGDGSGTVDAADYTVWTSNFGDSGEGWNSLEDQDYEGAGAPGTGNGWEEGPNSSDELLFETFLTASSEIASGDSINLGNAFEVGGTQTLTFEYHVAGTGANDIVVGTVTFNASPSTATAVPEPTTAALVIMAIGVLGVGCRRGN